MTPPEGYEAASGPGSWGFASPGALAWLDQCLDSGRTLHGWASEEASRRELTGRGRVFSIVAPAAGPDARRRWVVRHYRRGGAVASLLGDRYLALGAYRPVRETEASLEARGRGILTPAVVAGAVYPAGIFYRADLVTEEVPGARDLSEILFGSDSAGLTTDTALHAAGTLVRGLERAGIHHPDLNAKNIVLAPGVRGFTAHLVDLDRCCARPRGVPAPAFAMRGRLKRSLRKFEARTGRSLPSSAWKALESAYGKSG